MSRQLSLKEVLVAVSLLFGSALLGRMSAPRCGALHCSPAAVQSAPPCSSSGVAPFSPPASPQETQREALQPCSAASKAAIATTWADKLANVGDAASGDIMQHLPTILEYARSATRMTELGVRHGTTSWAFALAADEAASAGRRTFVRCVDVLRFPQVALLESAMAGCPGVDFKYIEDNDLVVGPWESDLLLIDTWHVYKQLIVELPRWAPHTKGFIILHDTTTFGDADEQVREMPINYDVLLKTEKQGLWTAVEDFLATPAGASWRVKERRTNNNGLTILERVT